MSADPSVAMPNAECSSLRPFIDCKRTPVEPDELRVRRLDRPLDSLVHTKQTQDFSSISCRASKSEARYAAFAFGTSSKTHRSDRRGPESCGTLAAGVGGAPETLTELHIEV